MTPSLYTRLIWLVDTIFSAGRISKLEIDRQWQTSALNTEHEQEYEIRTFHRHKEAIHDLFGIDIHCDRSHGHLYYLADNGTLRHPVFRSRLLSTLATAGVLDADKSLRQRVLFESVPDGYRFFTPILEAMRREIVLDVTYRLSTGEEVNFLLMPYCLKEYQRRWYVVGRSSKQDELTVYALDRILRLSFSRKHFKFPRAWKGERHFEGFFGVDRSSEPLTVTVRVTGKAVQELLRYPLHSSQHLMEQAEDQAVFTYWLAPTRDFCAKLHSFGSALEVLSPGDLRQRFVDDTQWQARNYGMNLHYIGEQLSLF